ncbi:hypothetical protein ACDN41_12345 [Priestia aryabhattai]|uniref:hypothetical protein n=1 Tax=Priestia aryabhattai TaxID=412384 RepID=UPI0035321099
MDYRIVYRDLNTGHMVDILCDDEAYCRLRKQHDDGEIMITYDEREEDYYGEQV